MVLIKELTKGDYFLYKNEPYMIKKNQIVVTGTHSHTKNRLDVVGLISGKNETFTAAPHDKAEVLEITRKSAQLISKSGNMLQIMDMVSYETFDAETKQEIFDELNEGDEVIYINFKGKNFVLEKKG